jgi:serine/threonine protein kinase
VLGKPAASFIATLPDPRVRTFLSTTLEQLLGHPLPEQSKPLTTIMVGTPQAPLFGSLAQDSPAIDLLEKLLVFQPEGRLTAEQALRHPYFDGLFDEEDDLFRSRTDYDNSFEDLELDADGWFAHCCSEISRFRGRSTQTNGCSGVSGGSSGGAVVP